MQLCARDLVFELWLVCYRTLAVAARRLGKTRVFSAHDSIGFAQCTLLQAIKRHTTNKAPQAHTEVKKWPGAAAAASRPST